MNKVFRVIWSEAQGAWVAVSETTKSHSKRSRKHALALALTAGSLMAISGTAVAQGKFVESGEASVAITSGTCSQSAAADGKNSVSIGCGAGAGAEGEFPGSKAEGDTSIGYQAGIGVKGSKNTAIGENAGESVIGDQNTAFGVSAGKQITGSKNTSLGFNTGFQIKGNGNLSAGAAAGGGVNGDNNVMLGTGAKVTGSAADNRISDTVVIGSAASAAASDNVAIGKGAQAKDANSVALGHASVTSEAKAITEGSIVDSAGTTHTYSGFAGVGSQANGVVSVGVKGAERQIINVAPGAITSSSTDAVNGSQLYGVAKGLNDQINNLDLGGGWVLGSKDADGVDQDLAVDSGGKVNLDAGTNMQVTSEQAADGTVTTTFATKDKVDFTQVTTGDTVMNTDGLIVKVDDGKGSLKDGPSITKTGINAGDLNITNVKAGTADTHGVNVSQLKGVANVIGGVTVDANGNYTGPTFNVNNTANTTIAGAIAELDKGWTFTAGGETDQVQAGDKVSLEAGKNMLITSTKDADGNITSTFLTKDAVEFDSVKTGDSLLNNTGLTVGTNVSVTNKGFTAGDVSLTVDGINAGNKKITNVAAGEISDTSLEAINGSQLHQTNTNVANNTTNITKNSGDITILQQGWTLSDGTVAGTTQVQAGDRIAIQGGDNIDVTLDATSGEMVVKTNPNVTHTSVTTGDTVMNTDGLTVGAAGGNQASITNLGFKTGDVVINHNSINAGGNQINNVQAGTEQMDAVNVSQLEKVQAQANKGWKLGSKDATNTNDVTLDIAPDGQVNLDAGKNMQVTSEQAADGTVTTTFATKADVEFDSVKTGDSLLNNTGLTVGTNVSVTNQGFTAGDVSLTVDGINAGNKKITNVAPGEISDTSLEAINGSQLHKTNTNVANNTTNITKNSGDITILQQGWTLSDGKTGTTQVKAGDTATIKAGDNMDVTIDDVTGEMIVKTQADVKFDSVTLGDITQPGQYTQLTQGGLNIGGNTFVNNGGLTFNNSSVSVSANGINAGGNKIINVAKGEDDSDAVNVGQLKDYVGKNDGSWNISDGTTSSKVETGNTVTIAGSQDGTTAGNINVTHDGNGNLTIESNANVKHDNVTVGETTINKDTGITVGDKVSVNKDGVTVGDVTINKDTGITVGGTNINNQGDITVGDVSITVDGGIHAGDNKITGVADGTIAAGSKDAVNGGQIHDMQVEINNQAGGWELNDGQGGKQQVKAGDSVSIVGGDNINVEFDAGGKMVVETNPDVTHNSVNIESTDANGDIVKGPSMNKDGIDAAGNKVTGVADGDINKDSTDAVNGSQLDATNNRVTKNEVDIESIQNGKDGMFQVSQDYNTPKPTPTGEKSVAGGAGAVASGKNSAAIGNDSQATGENSTALGNSASAKHNNSVALGNGSETDRVNSVSVGTVGGERQITNVAAGVAPTDAVNVSQLDALGSKVNQYFNAANKRIDKVDNNARAGIAAAMAAGTLPQSTLPGKSMVTVGASTYRGESALAIGVSRLSDNARTVIKANASADSRGNAGAAVGAGWHW